jgi:HEAT repeat protein
MSFLSAHTVKEKGETMDTSGETTADGSSRTFENLITALGDDDGMVRKNARLELVEAGKPVLPLVIESLESENKRVRWEAAKILTEVADETAAAPLVKTLTDEHMEIRWLAAEGLIAIGRDSLRPLLEALLDDPDSPLLREGAHHVLHDLGRRNLLNDRERHLLEVLGSIEEALGSIEPEAAVPAAAERALRALH